MRPAGKMRTASLFMVVTALLLLSGMHVYYYHKTQSRDDAQVLSGDLLTARQLASPPAPPPPPKVTADPIKMLAVAKREQAEHCQYGSHSESGGTKVQLSDFTMYVYAENDVISQHLVETKEWENSVLKRFSWALRRPAPGEPTVLPGGQNADMITFVDVGAHVGWFTLNIAAQGHSVVAFEGLDTNIKLLRSSVCANPGFQDKVTLYPYDLGSRSQQCWIYSSMDNVGEAQIMCDARTESEAKSQLQRTEVLRGLTEVHRLDEVISSDVLVMKVDVDGYELLVLRGAIRLLLNYKIWYMAVEYNAQGIKSKGAEPKELINLLDRAGYKISTKHFKGPYLDEDGLEDLRNNHGAHMNLFCVRKDASIPWTWRDFFVA